MFRVLTLNLNYLGTRHGAWPERRRRVVETLRALEPDVIALQAVRRTTGGDSQADELARELPGYGYVVFAPAHETDGGTQGSAILARPTVTDYEWRPLSVRPGTEDPAPRVVLRTRCAGGGAALSIFNVHFSWVEEQAADNVREALPFVSDSDEPALLVGDFNMTPEKPVHARFRDQGWTDLWSALRGQEPGYTFEADHPSMRIDYAYANAALASRARRIELVGQSGGSPPRLSDHLGLLVTLELS